MKEFKKWWNNQFSSRKGNDNSHLGYPEAHRAWQAALECMKAECIKMDEHHNIHCDVYCNCYNNVIDLIKEALEE